MTLRAGSPTPARSEDALEAALTASAIDPRLHESIVVFLDLLVRWNRVHNLTAVRDPIAMLDRHVQDSLTLEPDLTPGTLLDVGSGAGFPGLIVTLNAERTGSARPDRVVLLEPAAKRHHFLRAAIAALRLETVSVDPRRLEAIVACSPPTFETVTSRAFTDPERFVAGVETLVAPGGQILMMLGPLPESFPQSSAAAWPAGHSHWRVASWRATHAPEAPRRHVVRLTRAADASG